MSKEKQKENLADHGKILAEWKFPEITLHSRSILWYFVMSVVCIGLIIYAIVVSNYLFAIMIVLFAMTLFVIYRNPSDVHFKITEDGLEVGAKFYEYKQFERFWMIYEPPEVKNIYFDFK